MRRRERVLFLARAFPPGNPIAAMRSGSIARELARLGWQVTVVTVDPARIEDGAKDATASFPEDGVSVVGTGHLLAFRLRGFLRSPLNGRLHSLGSILDWSLRLAHVDSGVGWGIPVRMACARFSPGDFDVVLATGSPFSAFEVAARLGRRLRCPYVLDYRDTWTVSPHREKALPDRVRQKEQRLIDGAGAILTVSESMREAMIEQFGGGAKMHTVTNGFDPELARNIRPLAFPEPAIVYAGSFYPPKRVIDPVLRALRALSSASSGQPGLRLHYFGAEGDHVLAAAQAQGVSNLVTDHGRVRREQVLSALKGAAANVVITTVMAEGSTLDRGIVTGKLFEALGVRRPVLLVAPRGSDARKILTAAAAGAAFAGEDTDAISEFLGFAASEKTSIGYEGVDEFAWPRLGRRVDEILRNVTAAHRVQ